MTKIKLPVRASKRNDTVIVDANGLFVTKVDYTNFDYKHKTKTRRAELIYALNNAEPKP